MEDMLIPKEGQSTVLVSFLLDASGSMGELKESTLSGMKEYVDSLKKGTGKVLLSLTTFNSMGITKVYSGMPIAKVKDLTDKTYKPDGMTPLYDAIANGIVDCEAKGSEADKVLMVIVTDGHENSSLKTNKGMVEKMIKEKKKLGWDFAYLGSNQDAWAVGSNIGVAKHATLNVGNTAQGIQNAYTHLSAVTTSYRGQTEASIKSGSDNLRSVSFNLQEEEDNK